jgi:PAS domain S-box-containing protein
MNKKIKILHLEDSLKDSELIRSIIECGDFEQEYFLAENEKDFTTILEKENIDIILSDYSLPGFNGYQALKISRKKRCQMPFIFVSGVMGEDAAISAMLNGATDYVLKNKLERLVPAIKRALHEHELETRRKQGEMHLRQKNEQIEKQNRKYVQINNELLFQIDEKEKKAAELIAAIKDLDKLKEKFRLVVESSPTAMAVINDKDLITLVNDKTEKLFGYDSHELVGNKLEILISEKFRDQYGGQRRLFFINQKNKTLGAGKDLFAMRKNGTKFQVEISLNPIDTPDGPMVLVSILDLTERKEQETAQIKQLELELKNKGLEQFASIASHDLQEPLRTVSNYMQVFEEEYSGKLDDKANGYLHSVKKATNRMSLLIKSLLDFARLGHNSKLTKVDCKKLIVDVIADLDTLIKRTNTVINVKKMPILNVYEPELRELFQNLITNAIKFRKKNIHPEIVIISEKKGEQWEFTVADNGIGIAPTNFEKVFIIFQQLHTVADGYEGNGIGLANCKKIALLHQGDIWIESVLGQGSTFHFTIQKL